MRKRTVFGWVSMTFVLIAGLAIFTPGSALKLPKR